MSAMSIPSMSRAWRLGRYFSAIYAASRFSASAVSFLTQPVAICRSPSTMIQIARATTSAASTAGGAEPQPGTLAWTRHNSLNPFDARERSIVFPCDTLDDKPTSGAFSRRPEAVMEPSGNAKAAATDSRSGVSGLISSRAGTAQRIADLNFKNMPDGRVTQRGGFVHSWRRRLHRTRPTRDWHALIQRLFRLLTVVVSALFFSKKQMLKLSENEFGALNVGDLFGHAFRGDAHPGIHHTDVDHRVGRSREE